MAARIEDYALIGDGRTAALVSREGSIDWLCMPRLDAGACFASLLGTPENGFWRIGPAAGAARITRRYEPGTMILETLLEDETGAASVTDLMRVEEGVCEVIRIVRGLRGSMRMVVEFVLRTDYGRIVPWVERVDDGVWQAIAGADLLVLRSSVPLHGEDRHSLGDFEVAAGEERAFSLAWGPSNLPIPQRLEPRAGLEAARRHWLAFSDRLRLPDDCPAHWRAAVERSLLVLKALTYAPTGGIAAAATTSLPEAIGGTRNWDYRFCWLRDAAFTLSAFLSCGYEEEAAAWRDWLVRAVAGAPEQIQIMYGLAGERTLVEWEASWLDGYEGSRPVRIGNAAADQVQHDVFGEVAEALHLAAARGLPPNPRTQAITASVLFHLERRWREPDEGIWEIRGERRHFVHSKVMAWVAFDRAARLAARTGGASAHRWQRIADEIHAEVCERGFDSGQDTFVQAYGSGEVDAALLQIPLVGFLPASDPRVLGTVAAIERRLGRDGYLLRYDTEARDDGLPPGEGVFLACSFWLAEVHIETGRLEDARALLEPLLAAANDVGLLAEQLDPATGRMLGNFPQAFSHVGLVNTVAALAQRPATHAKAVGDASPTRSFVLDHISKRDDRD